MNEWAFFCIEREWFRWVVVRYLPDLTRNHIAEAHVVSRHWREEAAVSARNKAWREWEASR